MGALFRKAWRDLIHRPARSLLTILGVGIGVAGLVAIMSTTQNLVYAQQAMFANSAQADLVYWMWNAPPRLDPLLESDPRIRVAELRVVASTRWQEKKRWQDIELVGLDDLGASQVNTFELIQGRYPQNGEVLLDDVTVRRSSLNIGDELLYRDHNGRERNLMISGVARSPGHLSSAITRVDLGYVPASFLRRAFNIEGSNQLLIRLVDHRDVQDIVEYINKLSRRQGLYVGAPDIRNPDQFPGKRELDALIVIMFLFSGLGLVLSIFLIANTMSASISEQTNEIGILKTLGADSRVILALYTLEALVYGLVGTVMGILGGAVLGWRLLLWIGSLVSTPIPFKLSPIGILVGGMVGIVVSALGGLAPAVRGARISIREAITSYGIRADFGQSRLDRILQRLAGIPPIMAMTVRNLGRKRIRSLVTLLAIALATAAFVATISARESVNMAIDDIYETYANDAWLWLDSRVSTQFEQSFLTIDGVRSAEGWIISNGVVGLADARLWGIPADTVLYRHAIRKGRWYKPTENGVMVLSAELADAQQIDVGDMVPLQVRDQSRMFRIVGIAVDNTIFLGGTMAGKAFIPRQELARMLGHQDQVSLFALGLDEQDPQAVDHVLARLEARFRRWRPTVQPVYVEVESAQEASRLLTIGLLAMLIIIALVGSLSILNTLTLSVLERRREIAVLRVIGSSDRALLVIFIGEGLILAILGWTMGVVIGYPAGRFVTRQLGQVLFALDYAFTAKTIALSLIYTVGLSLVASLAPALAAAHTRASVGLRYE